MPGYLSSAMIWVFVLAFNFYRVFSVFEIALVVVGVAIVGGNGISRDFRLILAADSEPFVYAFL